MQLMVSSYGLNIFQEAGPPVLNIYGPHTALEFFACVGFVIGKVSPGLGLTPSSERLLVRDQFAGAPNSLGQLLRMALARSAPAL